MARGRHAKKIDTVHWTYGSFSALAVAAGASVAVNVLAAQHLPETFRAAEPAIAALVITN